LRNERDPAKIAAYYQAREARLRDEFRQQAREPQRTSSQFEQRTDANQNQIRITEAQQPAQLTVAEANAARTTLVQTARTAAMAGKKYWSRLEADINTVMSQQPVENQVDVNVWSTAYNSLVGANLDRLLREDAEHAANEVRISAERSAVPPGQEPAPPPLPIEVTGKILPGLNITEQQYRAAQANISKGVWPLTSDNTSGKRVLIGGGER
jgi:hypothetical protein